MKKLLDIYDLFIEQLRDIHSLNLILTRLVGRVKTKCTHKGLQDLLVDYQQHLKRTSQILLQVFNDEFIIETGIESAALVQEEKEALALINRCKTDEVRDASIVLLIQQYIHYKIATFGALCTYVGVIGLQDERQRLHEILDAEKQMDRQLADIALLDIDNSAYNYHY